MVTISRPASRDESGFSLIELIVAMAVSLGILGAAMTLTLQVQQRYSIELEAAAVRSEAQFALDWIARELRAAGANPYNITTSACPAAGTTFRPIRINPDGDALPDDLRMHADLNPPNKLLGGASGACTEANEDVTISHDPVNRVITRRDNNPPATATALAMTDGVITNLTFTYLDINRVVTAQDGLVAFVGISVTAQTRVPNPQSGQPAAVTVTDEVRVRVR